MRSLFVSLSLALAATAATADPTGAEEFFGHMMHDRYGMGFGFFGVGLMILFWGAIIASVVFMVRWMDQSSRVASKRRDPLDLLGERLANGDIDPDEYELRKRTLQG